jgi:hypothetical protein
VIIAPYRVGNLTAYLPDTNLALYYISFPIRRDSYLRLDNFICPVFPVRNGII